MMAFPTPGPMEVVFSFDTTGSMSQVLDEVKGRISDIVQRLQADIPGFKVGIIAHGDYCDQEHFYILKKLDLTDSVPDVVTFVNDTEGTGGGDVPECYELALQSANHSSWSIGSHRILVIIGDAYPHEPDYPLNTAKVDWRQELDSLAKKNIKIYAVQVQTDEKCTEFFTTLTEKTGGQLLKLANMQKICEVIMGVCYREKGPEFFQNYESEIRQKLPDNFGTDLENVFGTLRREESRLSDATALLDEDDDDVNKAREVRKNASFLVPDAVRQSRKRKLSPDGHCDAIGGKIVKKTLSQTPTTSAGKKQNCTHADTSNPKTVNFSHQAVKASAPESISQRIAALKRTQQRRERVPSTQFKYRHLSWSTWKLAVSPPGPQTDRCGDWKTVPQCGSDKVLWRRDLLDSCPVKSRRSDKSAMVFEISIILPTGRRRKVVSCHVSRSVRHCRPIGVFGLPWYRGLFRSVRQHLNKAASDGCRIYIRWARVTAMHWNIATALCSDYDYAWNRRSHSCVRDVI